jgi:hypothetical protein
LGPISQAVKPFRVAHKPFVERDLQCCQAAMLSPLYNQRFGLQGSFLGSASITENEAFFLMREGDNAQIRMGMMM